MRLSREPALLLISLFAPVVQCIAAFWFEADPVTAGALNAAAVAVAAALTAAVVRSEKLLAAITGAVVAVVALASALGFDWSTEQQALLVVPLTMVAGYVVRDRVQAPVPAEQAG